MDRTTYYKSETWLNTQDSPSTGSIVCYDGDIEYTEGESPCVFIEIADCHGKSDYTYHIRTNRLNSLRKSTR
ncbi:hypothetical protein [Sangeribacter muris]|uniref:hypothetical protein n=1 Tax=Sangeribacter muris TaxID=2880703 RepID=UPI00244DE83B|nr:hypothetical protein [Sangeribacter muris]